MILNKIKKILGMCNHKWHFYAKGIIRIYPLNFKNGYDSFAPSVTIFCSECANSKEILGREIKTQKTYDYGEELNCLDRMKKDEAIKKLLKKVEKKYNLI